MATATPLSDEAHGVRAPRTRDRAAAIPATATTIAGLLLVGAGALFLMGIITAEALYDGAVYTTHGSEISDLGATRPPDSVSYQPSSTIFNGVMIPMGTMILSASFFLHRGMGVRRVTISTAILGVGVLGSWFVPGQP